MINIFPLALHCCKISKIVITIISMDSLGFLLLCGGSPHQMGCFIQNRRPLVNLESLNQYNFHLKVKSVCHLLSNKYTDPAILMLKGKQVEINASGSHWPLMYSVVSYLSCV